MIQLEQLGFRYPEGEFRLHIPSLSVEEGAKVAVIGPSGSGKTTLLNLIAGIVTADSGRVSTAGTDVGRMGERRRRDFRIRNIGLVFQEFELLEYLSVLDNILLPYRINNCLRLDEHVRARAEELAREVGILDMLSRHPDRLSQGERQRVAVCRALIPNPKLLLADEPTGNLDPRNKGRVLDILFDYVAVGGATLLTVTHDHDLLPRFESVVDFREFHAYDDEGES